MSVRSGNLILNSGVIFIIIYVLLCHSPFFCLFRSYDMLRGGWLVIWTNDVQEQKKVKTKTKWAKLTYAGRQTKLITALF